MFKNISIIKLTPKILCSLFNQIFAFFLQKMMIYKNMNLLNNNFI